MFFGKRSRDKLQGEGGKNVTLNVRVRSEFAYFVSKMNDQRDTTMGSQGV